MCMTANDGNDVNQNVMETNNNLSAEQSLKIISETMARNCRAIEKNQGTYYILWGVILAVVSALIYLLWNGTGNPVWNYLWFLIPVIGVPRPYSFQRRGVTLRKPISTRLLAGFGALSESRPFA